MNVRKGRKKVGEWLSLPKTGEELERKKKEGPEHDWGLVINGAWHSLAEVKSSQIYKELVEKRIKKLKPGQIKTNWELPSCKNCSHPKNETYGGEQPTSW